MDVSSHRAPDVSRTAAAFDGLYTAHAPVLVREAFLLCGRRRPAERAVARAFRLAWERWPEVTGEGDPASWVRVAAHERALSPWRGVWTGRRAWIRATARAHPGPPGDRALVEALLWLPPSYRRAVVLHDGTGLDLPGTAAASHASTAATAGRLAGARQALAAWVPRVAEAGEAERGAVLHALLAGLAAALPLSPSPQTAPVLAARVRAAGERATRRVTWAASALVTAMAALIVTACLV